MNVGIGLPAAIPGTSGPGLLEWAKAADAGPFSSVGVIDRVVYPNFEALVTLAAAAAVTRRVRLITGVLLATVRNAGVLAKAAASVDAISGGRLTLGLGVGGRPDDFAGAPAEMKGRGKRFDEQLALMRKAWAGKAVSEGTGPIGPAPGRPGGPEVVLGGRVPAVFRRVGEWDGYCAPPVPPAMLEELFTAARKSWNERGRKGEPRLVGVDYFALGADAREASAANMRSYYGFMPDKGEGAASRVLRTPQEVKESLAGKATAGMDEVVLLPAVDDLAQVSRLADVVG